MERTLLDNSDKVVSEVENLEQYNSVIERIEEEGYTVLGKVSSSAWKLEDDDLDGVRTSFTHSLEDEDVMLKLLHYSPENGVNETVGYILNEDVVRREFWTNEEMMPEIGYQMDGSSILTPRNY